MVRPARPRCERFSACSQACGVPGTERGRGYSRSMAAVTTRTAPRQVPSPPADEAALRPSIYLGEAVVGSTVLGVAVVAWVSLALAHAGAHNRSAVVAVS